jgi:hypothetical protein
MGLSESFCYVNTLNPSECNAQAGSHDPVFGLRHPMRVVVGGEGIDLLDGTK